jgi:hypothetical protein
MVVARYGAGRRRVKALRGSAPSVAVERIPPGRRSGNGFAENSKQAFHTAMPGIKPGAVAGSRLNSHPQEDFTAVLSVFQAHLPDA